MSLSTLLLLTTTVAMTIAQADQTCQSWVKDQSIVCPAGYGATPYTCNSSSARCTKDLCCIVSKPNRAQLKPMVPGIPSHMLVDWRHVPADSLATCKQWMATLPKVRCAQGVSQVKCVWDNSVNNWSKYCSFDRCCL